MRSSVELYDVVPPVLKVLASKWDGRVLLCLREGPLRFTVLKRAIAGISKKVLIDRLHKLEQRGYVERKDLSAKTKHVEYSLTSVGHRALCTLYRIS